MGNGASVSDDFQVFQLLKLEYDELKEYNPSYIDDDAGLAKRLSYVREACMNEHLLPFIECVKPSVLRQKYRQLTVIERAEYDNLVLEAINKKEAITKKKRLQMEKDSDYSKSFSGSAADTKNEKEAAALMKGESLSGGGASNEDEDNVYLRKPQYDPTYEQFEKQYLANVSEAWKKFLGASDCYMYINVISKEVVSLRPDNYVDASEVTDGATLSEEEIKRLQLLQNPSNNLPIIQLTDLLEELDRIVEVEKKTPFIIDTSEEQKCRTYFSYKAILEDVSALTIPFAKSGLKRTDLLERLRKSLVGSIKSGSTFVLYLGQCSESDANWKSKLCKKDIFPTELFINSGKKLLDSNGITERYKLLYRDEDLEYGEAIAREGFKTIVISSLSPYEYEEKLQESLPLGYLYPIYVT